MKKIKFPPPTSYSNAKDYFSDFIQSNKAETRHFSFRFIALKLKWPAGYIPDIIAGRKALTLSRAVQFADYSKMTTVEKERFTWFALVESDNADVKAFFLKKLHLTAMDMVKPPISVKEPHLYNVLTSVCAFLTLKRQRLKEEEILKGLNLPYLNLENVKWALEEIQTCRYLTWSENGALLENNTNFVFDNYDKKDGSPFQNIELHKQTAQSFQQFVNSPRGPATYHSGFIQVRKGQFMTLALQIIALRNWLIEISYENIRRPNCEDTDYLMQFDMNLFPVTERKT